MQPVRSIQLIFLAFFLMIVYTGFSLDIKDFELSNEEYAEKYSQAQQQIAEIRDALHRDDIFDNDLFYYRQKLRNLGFLLNKASNYYQNRLDNLQSIINQFGNTDDLVVDVKSDKSGKTSYNEKLESSKRIIDEYKGRIFEIKLLLAEQQKLLNIISTLRVQIRNKDLFINNEPLYHLSAWAHGFNDIKLFLKDITNEYINLKIQSHRILWIILLGLAFVVYIFASKILLRKINSFIKKRIDFEVNTDAKHFMQLSYIIMRGVIPAYIIYWLFLNIAQIDDEISGTWYETFRSIALCVSFYFIFNALSQNLFLKRYKIYLDHRSNNKYSLMTVPCLVALVAMIFFIDNINFFSLETNISPFIKPDGAALLDFIFGSIFSLTLIHFVFYIILLFRQEENKNKKNRNLYRLLALFFFGLAIFYPIMTFIGSSNFSSGVLLNLAQSFILIAGAYLLYRSSIALIPILLSVIQSLVQKTSKVGDEIEEESLSDQKGHFLNYWLGATVGFLYLFWVVILVLLVWGIQPEKLYDWFELVFIDGIPIGEHGTFSLLYLFNAVIVLVSFYYATKVVQYIVDNKVLPYTNIDIGTKHAIRTTIGYIGLALSIVMFIYALGVDSTTLTFVISGLSVGIGFALQDLFKNFFAGFVLLIERPIKVGDWVNVNNDMGEVKKIRIRATVIETFNKNTLIIPNSSFVNSIVSNETLNPMSRAVIEVGVSYDANPREVLKILEGVAKNNERVYPQPAPSVIFSSFDDSSLLFVLRAFINKSDQVSIETDLRIEIYEALNENGISIPYPQRDIHVKTTVEESFAEKTLHVSQIDTKKIEVSED
ncbi:mechanosensitive ion channel [Francisellaceae bacterium]|nr:mechanosensitive ion channel [Francisellaceae bacterium]